MVDTRTWGWYQPGGIPGFSTSNQDNLGPSLNGTVLSVSDYREYYLRDLDGDGIINDADSDDGGGPFPGEGLVVDGVVYNAHEIALYTGSTVTANGVDYSVALVVTVLDNGAWGIHILDSTIPPNTYPADYTAARLGTFNGVEYSGTNVSSVDQMLCFAAETPIKTPSGWRRADSLRSGDMVITREAGARPLVFTQVFQPRRASDPNHCPVLIPQGALGARVDVRLSQQHRVTVALAELQLHSGHAEMLVPAKALIGIQNIRTLPQTSVSYVHLMTLPHSQLRVPGLWCESFLPGPWSLKQLPSAARRQLNQLLARQPPLRSTLPTPDRAVLTLLRHRLARQDCQA